ncbi:MAG: hypothetical protein AB4040_02050 [Synechococcus sp.]
MRVIFTNLDGSLLDAGGYGAARPALAAIERRNIPLILVTRRTRAEIDAFQEKLDSNHPVAIENGAAVLVPDRYFPTSILDDRWELHEGQFLHVFGLPYSHLRQVLQDVRVELRADIIGFGDWSEGELALAFGLTPEEAQLAHRREYSEIFTYTGAPKPLEQAIARHHLQISQLQTPSLRGQWYLTGNADMTAAVQLLLDCYLDHVGQVRSLGIGTDPTDFGWLRLMHHAALLPSQISSVEGQRNDYPDTWERAQLPGAEGWNEIVLNWLTATDESED